VEIGNEGWNFVAGGFGGDPDLTTVDFVNGLNNSGLNPGRPRQVLFGRPLVERLNSIITRQVRLGFLIEQEPDRQNVVGLSERHRDGLGLPRPTINYNLSGYTKDGLGAAKAAADKIFERLQVKQFTVIRPDEPSSFEWPIGSKNRLYYMGAGHICGTYRMGNDRTQSVVNREQRSWDHENLYLVGSGVFPTVGTANPTLTLAALSLWAADTIVKRDLR
jgi:choline dehydrogenase-like flavoprotein